MTALTSINSSGPHTVPFARPTDAIGSVLRNAFSTASLPDDMLRLLHRLDRRPPQH